MTTATQSDDRSLDDRTRRRGWWVVAAFVAMVAYVVLAHRVPGAGFVVCPFHTLTGYSCFGCGMTRSTGAFLHGDLVRSFELHPFGALFVVGFAVTAAHHLVQNVRGVRLDYGAHRIWRRIQMPALVSALFFLVVFGVARLALELAGILTPA